MTTVDRLGGAREVVTRWMSFNAVGLMGFVYQLGTLVAVTEWVQLHYLVGTSIAVEVAILHNFIWHERWTWRDRIAVGPRARWRRLLRFNLINIVLSMGCQVLFTGLYAEALGLHYVSANVLAIASCSLVNFAANDRVVFAAPPPSLPSRSSAI